MEKLQTGLYIRQKRMEHSWSLDGLGSFLGVCCTILRGKKHIAPIYNRDTEKENQP